MSAASLAPFAARMKFPVLVIGAGQGFLMYSIARTGLQVDGIDCSWSMARLAYDRRRQTVVVAYGEQLPFPAASYGTTIIASGVVTSGASAATSPLFQESLRVIRPGGQLAVGLFAPSVRALQTGQALGIMEGRVQVQGRLFDIWLANNDEKRQVELVAQWTGTSTANAEKVVARYRSALKSVFEDVEQLAKIARIQGINPRMLLRRGLNFALQGFSLEEARELFLGHGLKNIQYNYEGEISTLTLIAQV